MDLSALTAAVDTTDVTVETYEHLPLTLGSIDVIADLRAAIDAEMKRLEKCKERLTQHAMSCLGATGETKREGPAFIVQIVYPEPRATVDPVKLGVLGVDPDVIRAATKFSEAKPFVRFDKRKAGA